MKESVPGGLYRKSGMLRINPEKSGVALTALFNAESWQKDFQARFREYTGRELTPEEIDLLFEKAAEEAME